MKHLRVVLSLIVLLLGMAGEAIFTANAGAPVGGNALTPRVYLPLVARGESAPAPGTWITVMEEGFEAAPGPLWQFRDDNGAVGGAYQWGRRDCPPYTGSYSAWAVGGERGRREAAVRRRLSRQRPDHDDLRAVQPGRRAEGANALQVAVRPDAGRYFLLGASSDGAMFRGTSLYGQPSEWTTLDLDLDDLDPFDPGVSVLGKQQVWVAFRFTSDATGHTSPGPFVDDVLVRKCLDTLCSPLSPDAPAPDQTRAIRMLPTRQ